MGICSGKPRGHDVARGYGSIEFEFQQIHCWNLASRSRACYNKVNIVQEGEVSGPNYFVKSHVEFSDDEAASIDGVLSTLPYI